MESIRETWNSEKWIVIKGRGTGRWLAFPPKSFAPHYFSTGAEALAAFAKGDPQ